MNELSPKFEFRGEAEIFASVSRDFLKTPQVYEGESINAYTLTVYKICS